MSKYYIDSDVFWLIAWILLIAELFTIAGQDWKSRLGTPPGPRGGAEASARVILQFYLTSWKKSRYQQKSPRCQENLRYQPKNVAIYTISTKEVILY